MICSYSRLRSPLLHPSCLLYFKQTKFYFNQFVTFNVSLLENKHPKVYINNRYMEEHNRTVPTSLFGNPFSLFLKPVFLFFCLRMYILLCKALCKALTAILSCDSVITSFILAAKGNVRVLLKVSGELLYHRIHVCCCFTSLLCTNK